MLTQVHIAHTALTELARQVVAAIHDHPDQIAAPFRHGAQYRAIQRTEPHVCAVRRRAYAAYHRVYARTAPLRNIITIIAVWRSGLLVRHRFEGRERVGFSGWTGRRGLAAARHASIVSCCGRGMSRNKQTTPIAEQLPLMPRNPSARRVVVPWI